MPSSQWSLIGAGEIFMGPRSGGMLRSVGQTKEFKLEVKDETKEMRDYVNGGGTADSVTVIDKVEATFQFQSLSAKNLALALRDSGRGLVRGEQSGAHGLYRRVDPGGWHWTDGGIGRRFSTPLGGGRGAGGR
ncbi:MAG: hypothetical protein H7834_15975 [Magnetococcus sp. YQC-9]